MIFAFILLLAVILDILFSEPPEIVHPVCLMGKMANIAERILRNGNNGKIMILKGFIAWIFVLHPFVLTVQFLFRILDQFDEIYLAIFTSFIIYICIAPKSLSNHAIDVYNQVLKKDLILAQQSVGKIVGRNTKKLDMYGVSRACIESVSENLTDGVLTSFFWATVGLCFGSFTLASALVIIHRCTNVLDAMWGKKNQKYCDFGKFSAICDDILAYIPARLSLIAISIASCLLPKCNGKSALITGFKYRNFHESPNSAWSEAAFAGALNLELGGPAYYNGILIDHPWLGNGRREVEAKDIKLAIKLMWATSLVFLGACICCVLL